MNQFHPAPIKLLLGTRLSVLLWGPFNCPLQQLLLTPSCKPLTPNPLRLNKSISNRELWKWMCDRLNRSTEKRSVYASIAPGLPMHFIPCCYDGDKDKKPTYLWRTGRL